MTGTILFLAITSTAAGAVWQTGESMQFARYQHTASLMADGRVLIAGGRDTIARSEDRVELFDTRTGRWSWIAAPFSIGAEGAAIPLLTGEILIVGGAENPTGRAVLFNPRTDSWLETAPIPGGRYGHTATLLRDGRVLVVGGRDGGGNLVDGSWLYDRAAETWTSAGTPLGGARAGHTATLLSDGRVLVVGGNNDSASVTIYNPATGTWTALDRLPEGRSFHTTTLLPDGRALVAGGSVGTGTTYLFDPMVAAGSGQWSATGSLQTARSRHVAALLPDGRVFVAGGGPDASCVDPNVGNCASFSSSEFYSPANSTWSAGPALDVPVHSATATVLPSGELMLAGGFSKPPTTATKSASARNAILHVETGSWESTGSLVSGTHNGCETLLADGRLLAVAGHSDGGARTDRTEIYDPASGLWSDAASIPEGRLFCRATLLSNGHVLVSGGGIFDGAPASTYTYDPNANAWSPSGNLNEPRYFHSATQLPDGRVVVLGGNVGSIAHRRSAEAWNPVSRTWAFIAQMDDARQSHTATLLPSGKLVVTGGDRGAHSNLDEISSSVDVLDVSANSWRSAGQMRYSRAYHQVHLLGFHELLLVGGFSSGGVIAPDTEIFDMATSRSQLVDFSGTDQSGQLVPLPGGRLLFAGGQDVSSIYPAANLFSTAARSWVSTLLPVHSHTLADFTGRLLNHDVLFGGGWSLRSTSEVYRPYASIAASRFPVISSAPGEIAYGAPWQITGDFLADSEASSGTGTSSSASLPLVYMEALEGSVSAYLIPEPIAGLGTDPLTLTIGAMPPVFDPGFHRVTIIVNGIPSTSKIVKLTCSAQVTDHPDDSVVALGETATFSVASQGGRFYRWQRCLTGTCASQDWTDVPGASTSTYTTGPTTAGDAGTRYRVVVGTGCTEQPSNVAVLTIGDITPPQASVVSPSGGEFLLLSTTENPVNQRLITWSMSDNVRVCRVEVSLLYSNNGGGSYLQAPAGGGLPAAFGAGGSCAFPGETTTSSNYTVPMTFPSSSSGSLYKIQVVVTDQAGNTTTITSPNPFYIVQPNADSVKTLVVWNRSRMINWQGVSVSDANAVGGKLQELANHPRVQGLVVDLSDVTSVSSLFATWDADRSNATKANQVLFGSGGIHEYLRSNLLTAYSGVKYLVIVGDDRIIPMARIQDRTALLPETTYVNGVDLTAHESTVGQALGAGKYLSDDPLGALDSLTDGQLDGTLFIPDLAVGRLVETPTEIITTIATYIGQDGILDLTPIAATNKVLVTGYDFLSNVAKQMRRRWKSALGDSSNNNSIAPVDGTLVEGNWGFGSVAQRTDALRTKLAGNGGTRFGIMAIAGHATHYEEGVPGTDPFDIQGLSTSDIYGIDSCNTPSPGALQLAGGVVYAIGCHGGLPVPGSCRTDADRSLDLPQTMLRRGVVAYIANSGYGWSLKHGIGYGGRLVEIFTEQMTTGGTIAIGDAVKHAKQRYFLEAPRYDAYDEKSLMQWTLFGLPMYAVKTGITAGATTAPVRSASDDQGSTVEQFGAVRVKRSIGSRVLRPSSQDVSALALPPSLTQLNLSFDFTAADVYQKHDSQGNLLAPGAGCPDVNGCYYTLNGLVDRGTGSADLPIQPYLIYDSRLAGTSQHGVLWKGGTYDEESSFIPVIAELVSNGGDGSNHGAAPRTAMMRPTAPRIVPGVDSPSCRPSDLEVNSLTIAAGEAVRNDSTFLYTTARRYRNIDLEAYYFNNRTTPNDNCDRTGPQLSSGPFAGAYHQVTNGASTSNIAWNIPASDTAGVWRVMIVYSTNTIDGQSRGTWTPIELTGNAGNTIFTGNVTVGGTSRLTYVIQAIDNRGNVTWLDFTSAQLPSSAVALGVPDTVDVPVGLIQPPTNLVATASTTTSVAVAWTASVGATSYDVYRSASGTSYVKISSSASAAYTDNAASANTAYLYAIKAIDGASAASAYSTPDLATTVIFTDPTLTAGVTIVRAVHITELRAAVDAVRVLAGSGTVTFTDPSIIPGVTVARSIHISDIRGALTAALTALSLANVAFTDPTITSGSTTIRLAHIAQLRAALQ